VALALKETQEGLADLVAAPKLWLWLRAAHVALGCFSIIAECAGEHQCQGLRPEGHPLPRFPDLLQIKDLEDSGFGTAESKRVSGANPGSAHSNGLSGFCLIFTINGITGGDISQWLSAENAEKH
jgi:hypothetical protein